MGLDPAEKSWGDKHPYVKTVILLILIVAAGIVLKILQNKYMVVEEREYHTPVFLNESFVEFDTHFGYISNLSMEEQDVLFEEDYQYNLVEWTCLSAGCEKIVGKFTFKLICSENSFAEDLRVLMKEDCMEAAKELAVTVRFQLLSRTVGSYYLGRLGTIVTE